MDGPRALCVPHAAGRWRRRVPNILTLGRLALTALCLGVLSVHRYPSIHAWALPTGLALFVAAAITDALDGALARRWNATSTLGRILDPTADKILVIGAMVVLAGPGFVWRPPQGDAPLLVSGMAPWMVVLVLAREFLVTAMRGVFEAGGKAFGADLAGKAKMVLQSGAVPAILALLWLAPADAVAPGGWARWTIDLLVWAVVLATVLSGIPYGRRALRDFRESRGASR